MCHTLTRARSPTAILNCRAAAQYLRTWRAGRQVDSLRTRYPATTDADARWPGGNGGRSARTWHGMAATSRERRFKPINKIQQPLCMDGGRLSPVHHHRHQHVGRAAGSWNAAIRSACWTVDRGRWHGDGGGALWYRKTGTRQKGTNAQTRKRDTHHRITLLPHPGTLQGTIWTSVIGSTKDTLGRRAGTRLATKRQRQCCAPYGTPPPPPPPPMPLRRTPRGAGAAVTLARARRRVLKALVEGGAPVPVPVPLPPLGDGGGVSSGARIARTEGGKAASTDTEMDGRRRASTAGSLSGAAAGAGTTSMETAAGAATTSTEVAAGAGTKTTSTIAAAGDAASHVGDTTAGGGGLSAPVNDAALPVRPRSKPRLATATRLERRRPGKRGASSGGASAGGAPAAVATANRGSAAGDNTTEGRRGVPTGDTITLARRELAGDVMGDDTRLGRRAPVGDTAGVAEDSPCRHCCCCAQC